MKQQYCERKRPNRLIAEHYNSLSNFAFVFVGLVVLFCSWGDWKRSREQAGFVRNHLVDWPFFSFVYGMSCIYLGIGSFMFHAHHTRLTQQLDVGGMFAFLLAPTFYLPLLFVNLNWNKTTLFAVRCFLMISLLISDVLFTVYKWELSTGNVYRGLILTLVLGVVGALLLRKLKLFKRAERKVYWGQRSDKWSIRSVSLLVLSGLVFGGAVQVREKGIELRKSGDCDPDGFFQLHAVWHVLCSLPPLFIYLGLRSELVRYDEEFDEVVAPEKGPSLLTV